MKLTVLVDNNTLIDRYFCGEPGVSYFIQDGEDTILFDVGYSDVFIRNARKMAGGDRETGPQEARARGSSGGVSDQDAG
jgi:metal-dependent hydrolase (beta-lactamase superfamily II)